MKIQCKHWEWGQDGPYIIAALQEPCTTIGTALTALQENLKAKLELASLAPAPNLLDTATTSSIQHQTNK